MWCWSWLATYLGSNPSPAKIFFHIFHISYLISNIYVCQWISQPVNAYARGTNIILKIIPACVHIHCRSIFNPSRVSTIFDVAVDCQLFFGKNSWIRYARKNRSFNGMTWVEPVYNHNKSDRLVEWYNNILAVQQFKNGCSRWHKTRFNSWYNQNTLEMSRDCTQAHGTGW